MQHLDLHVAIATCLYVYRWEHMIDSTLLQLYNNGNTSNLQLCKYLYFFQVGTVTNPTIWLVLSAVQIFLSLTTVTVMLVQVIFGDYFFSFESFEKNK